MADIPKIRFKGFTEPWEQRKLGEVFEQTTNLVSPNEDEIELWSLTVEDGLTPKSERYNREFLVKKDNNFKEVRPGDIVYNPMNMTLGAVGYNGMAKSVAVSGYYTTMITKKGYDAYYINTWLKSPQAILLYKTYATGSLIEKQRVQFPTLSIIPAAFPNYDEQTKIGQYFESLDNLITLHQRKCDDTKELKKYMLQKMFPKNGEKFPEIRFKGFTEAWEQRKLGEILERRVEQRQQSWEYPRLAFASGQGVIPLNERKTNNREQLTKDEFTKKYLVTELDDIVYNPANVKYGAIDRNKCGRGLISPIYVTFTTSEIPGFIERIVTSHDFQQKALRFEEGTVTKRQSVNPEDFVTIDILVAPQKEEQRKISEYFDSLDKLITLHQRKCDTLKELKKYMLQNMFPKKG